MKISPRTYLADEACAFRFSRAPWGPFSNFYPLPTPIPVVHGVEPCQTSEHLYQAGKRPHDPEYQLRVLAAPSARDAARLGRVRSDHPDLLDWPERRITVMRWVIRRKRETNPGLLDAQYDRSADRPIVEVSTRDPFWGARPDGAHLRGCNVLGRLHMELRRDLLQGSPRAAAAHWEDGLPLGILRPGACAVPARAPGAPNTPPG